MLYTIANTMCCDLPSGAERHLLLLKERERDVYIYIYNDVMFMYNDHVMISYCIVCYIMSYHIMLYHIIS